MPVSDAMLAQFAQTFRVAAAAVPVAAASAALVDSPVSTPAPAPSAVQSPPVKELNALALMWTVFKGWLAGLFGRKP